MLQACYWVTYRHVRLAPELPICNVNTFAKNWTVCVCVSGLLISRQSGAVCDGWFSDARQLNRAGGLSTNHQEAREIKS